MEMRILILLSFSLVLPVSCSEAEPSDAQKSGETAVAYLENAISEDEIDDDFIGDGPFGIPMGVELEKLNVIDNRDEETGLSVLERAPDPSNQFPRVAVVSFPETGVCEVRALSELFDSDPYITAASPFVDRIADALSIKYGQAKKQDGCSGSACRSDYSLMHINDGSKWYGYEWNSSGDNPLASDVRRISLYITNPQFNDLQARIDYEFNNREACNEAATAALADGL